MRRRGQLAHGDPLVFDASTPIAISCMRRPDLFDRFRELGCELAIPSYVERDELISADVRKMIGGLLDRGTIRIVRMNRRREVIDFAPTLRRIGIGESDAILTCIKMRLRGEEACCVLDEKEARAAARRIGIRHIGLAGLLGEIASAGLVSAWDMDGIVASLRKSNFYIGDGLLDGLAGGI